MRFRQQNRTDLLGIWWLLMLVAGSRFSSSAPAPATGPGAAALADYFRAETDRLEARCLAGITSREQWEKRRAEYRAQLFEMLGLSPVPERTDLQAEVTGRTEREDFVVENVHFQSMPGLYVTANLYLPKGQTNRVPAILYLSGHGGVKRGGISFGNKVHYQHHGIWFARHGYVCLILDTVQLGEIEGIHHGTYREGMWWWNARGYTPAGVEAWNGIRALDYLETRPEVDGSRMGATGRSGGGAYTWWVAALDERIRAAAPVAGITDLHNHVVDGTVEGHCDCMFMVNTYRWDYPLVAALVAPRPLLIVNTDRDSIFPLDGVLRVHEKVRRVYQLYGAAASLGLVIAPGPHQDTQDLQVPVFRWFNQHLKGADPVIASPTETLFEPETLKVFARMPAQERTSCIHETFVPKATPSMPDNAAAWAGQRERWRTILQEKCFAGWPEHPSPLASQPVASMEGDGLLLVIREFDSQPHVRLRLYMVRATGTTQPRRTVLTALDDTRFPSRPSLAGAGRAGRPGVGAEGAGWGKEIGDETAPMPSSYAAWLAMMRVGFEPVLGAELETFGDELKPDAAAWKRLRAHLEQAPTVLAFVTPRGVGMTAWYGDVRKQIQMQRRYLLLGQTLAGMRVWDIRRAVQTIREVNRGSELKVWLQGTGDAACHVVYAALFETGLSGLELWNLPISHREGPDYLNVLRFMDVAHALTMAAERVPVRLHEQGSMAARDYCRATAGMLGWDASRLRIGP